MDVKHRWTLSIILFLFSSTLISAQQLNHVLGDLLIKPKTEEAIPKLLRELQFFEGNLTQLKLEQIVPKPMDVWLLKFDHTQVHEGHFLRHLKNHPTIELAQFNHLIKERVQPNDPLFFEQWQYINTGQGGGMMGADLDADEAWDIATGGVTVNGDTIVVCMIDGGVDADHEDLVENLWVNPAEIPNNNIDDDGNGYVDDYRGWNANSNSDNIDGNSHGTSVAGIVGAKGNNLIGVSGINWDVDLMIVRGGSSVESQVLKAYGYPLAFRKKYNETDGQEGAFVVATNASWGTDYGQAEDAPIWCAFYDSLGVAGILNCGATINESVDVEQVGDLPTGCTSDYLIGVTNMDRNDELNSNAGYGANSIDLGAFGEGTYTTSLGNNYGGFGGTSGATPHVTGTIALMYAAPCGSLASLASNDPAAAALLVKQYILEGVDPNESLDGITLTGGRLNMKNAMEMVMDNCSACPLPSSINALNISDTEVTFSWVPSQPSISVNIQYRAIGTNTWTTIPSVTNNSYTISALLACTEYEYQLETNCMGETSGLSNFFQFKTDGCCVAPSIIQTGTITETSLELTWNAVLAATGGYSLRYRAKGTTMWSQVSSADPEYNLENLSTCTIYEFQLRSICATGPTDFGPILEYTTMGCGTCTEQTYCVSEGNDTGEEWIETIQIDDFINNSGNNGGYGDYTDLSMILLRGESHDVTLTPGFAGLPFFDYFRIFIDFNQDGEFDNDTELVFDLGESFNEAISGQILIPADAPFGNTRMRISMKFTGTLISENEEPQGCETLFDYGEVEDYCVEITEPDAIASLPFDMNVQLYPNPFSNNFFTKFTLEKATNIQFELTDIQGRRLHQFNAFYSQGEQIVSFEEWHTIPSGMYFLTMKTEIGQLTRKLVKE